MFFQIQENSLIHISECICNTVGAHRAATLLSLAPVSPPITKIGIPVDIETVAAEPVGQQQQQQQLEQAAAREAAGLPLMLEIAESLEGGAVLEAEELDALERAWATAGQAIRSERARQAWERESVLEWQADAAEERARDLEWQLEQALRTSIPQTHLA